MRTGTQVFLFEYATCTSQPLPPSVAVEGMGMFKSLYDGFLNPFSFYHLSDYSTHFREALEKAEHVLAIAPETDMELYRLTKMIESSGCENLGSTSEAVKISSDKLLTYSRLKDLAPKTELFRGKTSLDFPLIAKPRDGVSSEGIRLVRNEQELKDVPSGYLVQDYVEGMSLSASVLVGDETRILSINTQEFSGFDYMGSKLPVDIKNTDVVIEAIDRISGLFGYVGIDFVVRGEEHHIIEVNPRPTTPIIGLNQAFDMNISELIIKNYSGEKIQEFPPKRGVTIRKTRSGEGYIAYGGYSIEVELT